MKSEIDRALDGAYSALTGDVSWEKALDAIARAVDADACSIVAERSSEKRLNMPASSAYQEFLIDFVKDGWSTIDHRAKRGWPLLRGGGRMLLEQQIVTSAERQTMPVYHELYAKFDLTWWAAISFQVDGTNFAMPLLRSCAKGPFTPASRQLLEIVPHLTRIMRLRDDIRRRQLTTAVELLEAGHRAVLIIDSDLRVLATNRLADQIIGPDIYISRGKLHARNAKMDAILQRFVGSALQAGHAANLPKPITIERLGRRPIGIDTMSPPKFHADSLFRVHAMLVLTDMDQISQADTEKLKAIFKLSPAEAKLAMFLCENLSLAEASTQLSISKETARTQLKSIFAKTHTNSQTELVRLFDKFSLNK